MLCETNYRRSTPPSIKQASMGNSWHSESECDMIYIQHYIIWSICKIKIQGQDHKINNRGRKKAHAERPSYKNLINTKFQALNMFKFNLQIQYINRFQYKRKYMEGREPKQKKKVIIDEEASMGVINEEETFSPTTLQSPLTKHCINPKQKRTILYLVTAILLFTEQHIYESPQHSLSIYMQIYPLFSHILLNLQARRKLNDCEEGLMRQGLSSFVTSTSQMSSFQAASSHVSDFLPCLFLCGCSTLPPLRLLLFLHTLAIIM